MGGGTRRDSNAKAQRCEGAKIFDLCAPLRSSALLCASASNSSRHCVARDRQATRMLLKDVEAENLYDEVFVDKTETYVRWTLIDDVNRYWRDGELIIEPGETHMETFEFIVPSEIDSVLVYTYFYNPAFLPCSSR